MDPTLGVAASSVNVKSQDFNSFGYKVDEIQAHVDELEKQVNEVEQFYHSTKVQVNNSKDKGREKYVTGTKNPLQGTSHREATAAEKMQELMRQFSTILQQITQHKWAWPFMEPVDVEGLGLYDYYKVIDKPMDFSTIKSKMNARDGSGYKNVREIYSDVRLIFKNAMKYNDEKNDIHVMAKTLLEKFEKKWILFLPKVTDAETIKSKEEARAQLDTQLAQEATYANMARELSKSLCGVDTHLKNLKAMVIEKYRKLSTPEKIMLATDIAKLSPENINRALQIVAEDNPTFQPNAEEVDLDIDAQSDYTIWRLKNLVKNAPEVQGRTAEGTTVNHNGNAEAKKNDNKRRRVM